MFFQINCTMKKINILLTFLLTFLSIACSNEDLTETIKENNSLLEYDLAQAHNATLKNFFNGSKNVEFDKTFKKLSTRGANLSNISDKVLLEDVDLTMKLVRSLIECVPNIEKVSEKEKQQVTDTIYSYLLRAKQLSMTSGKSTYEVLIDLGVENGKISSLDSLFLTNVTKNQNVLCGEENESNIASTYLNILKQSDEFWRNKNGNMTRASADSKFLYEAFYDAVGGGIGACLGSGLPAIGNFLLGTALSTTFSYAADLGIR